MQQSDEKKFEGMFFCHLDHRRPTASQLRTDVTSLVQTLIHVAIYSISQCVMSSVVCLLSTQ